MPFQRAWWLFWLYQTISRKVLPLTNESSNPTKLYFFSLTITSFTRNHLLMNFRNAFFLFRVQSNTIQQITFALTSSSSANLQIPLGLTCRGQSWLARTKSIPFCMASSNKVWSWIAELSKDSMILISFGFNKLISLLEFDTLKICSSNASQFVNSWL